jgi:hypothetical protein
MAKGVLEPKNPIVGSFPACCALAASGHAAAPPTSVMNSRRLTDCPQTKNVTLPHRWSGSSVVHHSKFWPTIVVGQKRT